MWARHASPLRIDRLPLIAIPAGSLPIRLIRGAFCAFCAFCGSLLLASFARGNGLRQVEAIEIHHLDPRVHEVAHELLLSVVASVDFGDGSELGV